MLTAFAAPRKRKAVDDRVYLVHADELKFDMYGPNPDAQIVKGHVHFLHRGATLTCDSAYFYQTTNSVRAMGHVHFRQPQDKITLTCQRAWYDGEEQLMEARNNVVLHHARQTLYTDSLNYDRLYNNAYFFRGGRLIDGSSKLSSDWGEYNTQTKQAVFYYDVQLHTPKTRVSTDTLYYDTRTSRAHVVGQYTPNKGQGTPRASRIVNGQNVITTTDAYFNTKTDKADLYGRSTVVNKEKTITADTLFYNSKTGRNYGRGNVVYVDKRNKNQLTAHLVVYNEKTGRGFATGRALVKDYSRPDTLWMHGDTMRVETFHINTDSAYRKVHCYPRVRIFRNDAQAVCDSLAFTDLDSLARMYNSPVVWNEVRRQYSSDSIYVLVRNQSLEKASLMSSAFIIVQEDSLCFDQIRGAEMLAFFDSTGALSRFDALGGASGLFYIEENDAFATVNKFEAKMFTARMKDGDIHDINYFEDVKSDAFPVVQLRKDERELKGYRWQPERRPATPSDVTSLQPRRPEREKYEKMPRPKFKYTEKYFPGYMDEVHKELARQDSLARVRRAERARQREIADSLAVVAADSLAAVAADSLHAATDSLSSRPPLPDAAAADSLDLKPAADSTLAAPVDSLPVLSDTLSSGQLKQTDRERKRAEREQKKAEREQRQKARIDAREAKWAELDARDAAKEAAKQEKQRRKQRIKTRKILQAMEKREAKEQKIIARYKERYMKQKEKKRGEGGPEKEARSRLRHW